MDFERLNIFATEEEISAVKSAMNAPLMGMTNPAPPGPGVPATVPMFLSPQQVVHASALAHGLPEFEGYYGMDLTNGEFVRPT